MPKAKSLRIKALAHDFAAKKSFVTVVWENDATQSLVLPVKFGCSFEELPAAAEKAVRELADEIATIPVKRLK
jgi:hypothetical protein